MRIGCAVVACGLLLCFATDAYADRNKTFILATGRRDPRMYAIDLAKALRPENQNTPNAIVSRSKTALDRLDGKLLGDPANIVISEDRKTAFVVNHHGAIDNDQFLQHGSLRGEVELALAGADCETARHFKVPFVSPNAPPSPIALLSPDATWGCFPDSNGIAVGHGSNGKSYLFTANGGTDDVSVIDLERALAGDRRAEILRIPTQIGPWGIAASPNGRWIVAANRESQKVAFEGNTISIIDVDLARTGSPNAEVARVRVGTDSPSGQTRPFIPSFTPDGKEIVVPNFRSNNVSIVNLALALAKDPGAEVARIPLVRPAEPDGAPIRASRPKGSAVTSDGRYAVISAGPRVTLNPFLPTGTVSIIDLERRAVVATVTGVGNDPYGLAVVDRALAGHVGRILAGVAQRDLRRAAARRRDQDGAGEARTGAGPAQLEQPIAVASRGAV